MLLLAPFGHSAAIKKGIINNYFFILLMKNFFRASKNDFWASRCWLQLARRAFSLHPVPRISVQGMVFYIVKVFWVFSQGNNFYRGLNISERYLLFNVSCYEK